MEDPNKLSVEGEQNKGSRSRIANYQKILANNPRSFIFAQLAEEYIKLNETDKAIQICQQGLAFNPDFSDGLYVLGVAHYKLGKKDNGRRIFLRILASQPEHYLAREALRRMGLDDQAIAAAIAEGTEIGDLMSQGETTGEAIEPVLEEQTPEPVAVRTTEPARQTGVHAREMSSRRAIPTAAGDVRSAHKTDASANAEDEDDAEEYERPAWLIPVIAAAAVALLVAGYFGYVKWQSNKNEQEISALYAASDTLISRDTHEALRNAASKLEIGIASFPKALSLRALAVQAYAKLLLDFTPDDMQAKAQIENHFTVFPTSTGIADSDMLTAQAYRAFYLGKQGDVRFLIDTAGEKGLLTPAATCLDGELHAFDRRFEEAIRLYDEALADDAEQWRAMYKKGEAQAALKDYAAAKITLDLLLEKEPDHLRGRLLLAKALWASGANAAELKTVLDPVLKLERASVPSLPRGRLLFLLAALKRMEGANAEAIQLATESIGLKPSAEAHFMLAELQAGQNLYDAAKKNALAALTQNPDERRYNAFLGRMYFLEDKKTEALKQMELAIDDSTNELDLLVTAGDAAAALRYYDKAVEYYERASFVNFENLDLKKKLILVYIEKQDLKDARRRIDKLLADNPQDPLTYFLNGKYYLAEGSAQKAEKEFLKGLEFDPNHRDLLFEMASLLFSRGDIASGVAIARKLERLRPDDPEVLSRLAAYNLAAGSKQEARRLYTKLTRLQPQLAAPRLYLALLDWMDGKKAEAKNAVEKELAASPGLGVAQIVRGAFYLDEGDPKKAETHLQEGIKLDSKNPEGHYWLGLVKLHTDDPTWAKNEFEVALECQPVYPRAEYEIAMIHFRDGTFGAAKQVFVKAYETFKLFPETTEYQVKILLRLGEIEIMQNRVPQGLALARKASSLDPNAGEPYYIMAREGDKFSNPKKALELLDKALTLDPALNAVYYERGLIYMAQDKSDQAIAAFKEYLRLAPKGPYSSDVQKQLELLGVRGED
ncbi:MAG: hypothetical protein C4523_00735 [Myxococcales bacterium]|nr:MAG: hypothetical protein C4523_00735 [Myxococcales bacterium]